MRTAVLPSLAAIVIVSLTPAAAPAQHASAPLGPREQPSVELRRAIAPVGAQALSRGTVHDTTAPPIGNRRLHAVIGAGIGFAAGFIVGKSVDGGRAGCNREGSGQNCDWLSGYEEIIGGLAGAAIGGVIGALLPHD